MNGINEVQVQVVNRLYLLTVNIGRARDRLLLTA
jgi:hypothetical protein